MELSQRTKKMRRRRNFCFILSNLMWIGTAVVLSILAFKKYATPKEAVESTQILSEAAKTLILSMSTTVFIGIIATIIIKDKMRTFMWTLSVVISAIMFDRPGMLIVLGMWLIEEYIIHNLYIFYKEKVSINKEIDRRE